MTRPNSARPPIYRPDIDGLRAVAILLVVGFHAFPDWIPGGFVGVDVFFVISGFLITGILLDYISAGGLGLGAFYMRRVRRLFPALITVMLAVLGAGWVFLSPDEYRQAGKHLLGGASFTVNGMLWDEAGYFDGAAATKPLLHLWSLGVEEQFYIVWPLVLAAAWHFRKYARVIVAGVFTLSLVANLWFSLAHVSFDFYSPLTRFWELLAGGGLAWTARQRREADGALANEWAMMGVFALALAVILYDKNMPYPGWRALLPVIGTGLLIARGEHSVINRYLLAHPWMVGVGLVSYPLYLWHWPLLSFAHLMSDHAAILNLRIEMVALSVILAAATYWFIERPFRHRRINRQDTVILCLLMMAVGVGGGVVWAKDGFPARFAASAFPAAAYDSKRLDRVFDSLTRVHECSLYEFSTDLVQQPSCLDAKRPLLMLWGDSHAAAIYPGVHELQKEHDFGVGYYAQGGCPPLFHLPHETFRNDCKEVNERLLASLPRLHPDVIMLASIFSQINQPLDNDDIVAKLAATIDIIHHAAPYAKIIVLGPAPRWTMPMPAMYQHEIMARHKVPPERMVDHLDAKITALEAMMKAQVVAQGVIYLSQQEALCNQSGCLTRLGDGADSLTYVDQGHIAYGAAIYEMHQFAPQIVAALGLAH